MLPGIRKVVACRDKYISLYNEQLEILKQMEEKIVLLKESNLELCERNAEIVKKIEETEESLIEAKNNIKKISGDYEILQNEFALLQQTKNDLEKIIEQKNAELNQKNFREQTEKLHSGEFWDKHYQHAGDSGTGSYGRLSKFKSEIVNAFVKNEKIHTVLEIGCGDGNQLKLMEYEHYVGVDVSAHIIEADREIFQGDSSKEFYCSLTEREKYANRNYDLVLSMDVIFHLLEDEVFHLYMDDLFGLASKFVVIYSSNHEEFTPWPEYRHRNFTGYVADHFPEWKLIQYIPNKYPYQIGKESETSASDFYIFQRQEN